MPKQYSSVQDWEARNKAMCAEVQRDPYSYLMSNAEQQKAKHLPIRMCFNLAAMGAAGFFYLSRHNEINRVKRLIFSLDMMVNVGSRALVAGVVSHYLTKNLFVN